MLLRDTNREILEDIKKDLLEELGIEELKRYYKEFPKENDFNIVQYGYLLISYSEEREFLEKYGIITKYAKDDEIYYYYRSLVGFATIELIEGDKCLTVID